MTLAETPAVPKNLPSDYAGLVAMFTPRPIRDDVGFNNTVAIIDALAVRRLNSDQEEYLELLSQLVEAYENQHVKPLRALSGLALVRALLAENEMTGDDFADILGVDRSVAYKILKADRNLTTGHVRKLSERFQISADALLA